MDDALQNCVYISEINEADEARFHAGSKARQDVDAILEQLGIEGSPVSAHIVDGRDSVGKVEKLKEHFILRSRWRKAFAGFNDKAVIMQFPPINHTLFIGGVLRKSKRNGNKLILFVHDVELLRYVVSEHAEKVESVRTKYEEEAAISEADCVVVHNDAMKEVFARAFEYPQEKIVTLEIFDYLVPDGHECDQSRYEKDAPVVVAGNLLKAKAGYLYDVPSDLRLNLYGAGFNGELTPDSSYFGPFPPDDLPNAMEGSFGIVWDGISSKTCEGAFGEYLRVNNPHKASLYLSSGLPIITWKEAAIARFVEKYGVGFAVSSMDEIPGRIEELDDARYKEYLANVSRVSRRLRSGFYTIASLSAALNEIGEAQAALALLQGIEGL